MVVGPSPIRTAIKYIHIKLWEHINQSLRCRGGLLISLSNTLEYTTERYQILLYTNIGDPITLVNDQIPNGLNVVTYRILHSYINELLGSDKSAENIDILFDGGDLVDSIDLSYGALLDPTYYEYYTWRSYSYYIHY